MPDDHEENDPPVDLDNESLRARLEELKAKVASLHERVTALEDEQRESTNGSE